MPYPSSARVSTPTTRRFVTWMKVHRGLSDSTVRAYGDAVERFVAFMGVDPSEWETPAATTPNALRGHSDEEVNWSTVTVEHVEEFAAFTSPGGRKPSASGYRIRVAALRLLFEYLSRRGVLDANPAKGVTAPRGPRRNPRPITDAHWLKVWTSDLGVEERLVVGLGYFCGLRRHEIALLRVEHVDAGRGVVRWFDRKGGKEGGEVYYGTIIDRMVSAGLPVFGSDPTLFRSVLAAQVERRAEWGEDRLLGSLAHVEGSTDAQPVNRMVEGVQRRLAIAKPFTPHQLRHSFATNCVRIGMPIQVLADQMSHAEISTTLRYVDSSHWFKEDAA